MARPPTHSRQGRQTDRAGPEETDLLDKLVHSKRVAKGVKGGRRERADVLLGYIQVAAVDSCGGRADQ